MKKIIILFLFIILSSNLALANIEKIPKQRINEYKSTIENIISSQEAKSINDIDNIYKEASDIYSTFLKNKNQMKRNFENIEKLEDIEQHLDSPEFYLYLSLIEETDKFIEKKLDVPPTDWSGSLAEVILPYLEKYKISNYDKLVAISKYAGKKQTSVEQIRQEIYDYSVEYETKKAENFSKNLQNKLINLDTILFTNNPQVLKKNTIYITNAQI